MSSQTMPPSRRKVAVLSVTVAALVAGAFAVRSQFAPPVADPLHGDYEAAIGALDTKLKTMPQGDQLALLKAYAADPAPGLRFAAVERIADEYADDPEAVTILEHAYRDSSSVVRQKVIESLPDINGERGYRLLLTALRDEDSWMRDAAVTALKFRARTKNSIVDARAVPVLIASLDDERPYVSSTAVNVLKTLTGKTWVYKSTAPQSEKDAVHARWKQWGKTQKNADALPTAVAPERSDPAPRYALRDIGGKHIGTESQRGRVTLLNFWGTWCPPCQVEVPDLVKLDAAYRGRGVDIIGVAVGERKGAEGLRKWCAAHGVTYSQTLAVDKVQHDFGDIDEVPVTVLIDGAGNIRRRWEGERDFGTFRAAVDAVLSE